jgi:excisionase family DNA binding protein
MDFDIRQQELFPIQPSAAHCGVSASTFLRAIERGELKAVRVAGRVMIPRSEIERIKATGMGHGRKRRSDTGKNRPARAGRGGK